MLARGLSGLVTALVRSLSGEASQRRNKQLVLSFTNGGYGQKKIKLTPPQLARDRGACSRGSLGDCPEPGVSDGRVCRAAPLVVATVVLAAGGIWNNLHARGASRANVPADGAEGGFRARGVLIKDVGRLEKLTLEETVEQILGFLWRVVESVRRRFNSCCGAGPCCLDSRRYRLGAPDGERVRRAPSTAAFRRVRTSFAAVGRR